MKIKGLQKLTLLDFPERIACTVFLGGCNFRCPFCHNASLVLPDRAGENISEEELFAHLEARRGRISGVCISGGEPTLHKDLPDFIRRIKAAGFAVKLDTNGYQPAMLSALISEGILDYAAMDIKSSPSGYGRAVGIDNFDLSPIRESAELLMSGNIPFEFRTTVVRGIHTEADIRAIGEWLRGDESFFLQSYKDSGDILSPNSIGSFSDAEMQSFEKILREYIPKAAFRG